jgi:hypothetical protein
VRPGDEEGTKNGKTSVYMYKFICATVIRAYRTRDNRKNSLKVEYFNFLPPSLPPFPPSLPPSHPPTHPLPQDANKDDPTASKKFMEFTEAYEVLGDDKKRQVRREGGREEGREGGREGGHGWDGVWGARCLYALGMEEWEEGGRGGGSEGEKEGGRENMKRVSLKGGTR